MMQNYSRITVLQRFWKYVISINCPVINVLKNFQRDLVKCLEFGLVSKCARICVQALTVCALEMDDVMMRQLPSVLLNLSKISATVAMAIPLMEFLSSRHLFVIQFTRVCLLFNFSIIF